MKKKKIPGVLLAIVCVLSLVSGCGGKVSPGAAGDFDSGVRLCRYEYSTAGEHDNKAVADFFRVYGSHLCRADICHPSDTTAKSTSYRRGNQCGTGSQQ